MFGILESKSERLVKKAYKLHRELAAAGRMALRKNTDFSWKYYHETGRNLFDVFMKLNSEKGEEYVDKVGLAIFEEDNTLPEIKKKIRDVYIEWVSYNDKFSEMHYFQDDKLLG